MAVACGEGFTVVVTEQGGAWACGINDDGQLGLGSMRTSFCQRKWEGTMRLLASLLFWCRLDTDTQPA